MLKNMGAKRLLLVTDPYFATNGQAKQIADSADVRLEPARLAPSAVNSQPWYFVHEGDTLHVYCSRKGSRLDAGIALAHLFVANEERFRFFRAEKAGEVPDCDYIGSVML